MIRITGYYLAIPLYLLGSLFDFEFSGSKAWLLLGFRLSFVISTVLIISQVQQARSLFYKETWALIFTAMASGVCFLVTHQNHTEPYYFFVGLNLVGVAALASIPWRPSFYPLGVLVIYGPFFAWGFHHFLGSPQETEFITGWFFVFGTVLISIALRVFYHYLRDKALWLRVLLIRKDVERGAILEKNETAAHDLVSPLEALQSLLRDPNHDSKKNRSLLNAIAERIQGISKELTQEPTFSQIKSRTEALLGSPSQFSSSLHQKTSPSLKKILTQIIEEKRAETRHLPWLQLSLKLKISQQIDTPMNFELLQRALSNLINNSIEAKHPHHNLRIHIEAKKERESLVISVEDNGIGMPEELVHPLNQGRPPYLHTQGLGLNQVVHFLKSSQGFLKVRSLPQKGTRIELTFPSSPSTP